MSKAVKRKKQLTKKEYEDKEQLAYLMYMAGTEQKLIAVELDLNPKTISDWATKGKWKYKRTAGTITRDELVNKCLTTLNKILEDAMEEGADMSKLPDDLVKMANTIEKLDKKNNVVYNIETFTGFNKYLLLRMQEDKQLIPDTVKLINKLQNDYVTQRMSSGQ
ncbi:MAG: terminase gpP N-terminus-related DNA-binding protein [Bacteroidota bacterium]